MPSIIWSNVGQFLLGTAAGMGVLYLISTIETSKENHRNLSIIIWCILTGFGTFLVFSNLLAC